MGDPVRKCRPGRYGAHAPGAVSLLRQTPEDEISGTRATPTASSTLVVQLRFVEGGLPRTKELDLGLVDPTPITPTLIPTPN